MKQRNNSLWLAIAAVAVWLAAPRHSAAQDALFHRTAEVRALLSHSRQYHGEYEAEQMACFCGETDPLQFDSGQAAFAMEFPLDDDGDNRIVSVRFNSTALVGGVKETDKFYVSIDVKTDRGTTPPSYVVDTQRPTPGDSGRASLNVDDDGTERIHVVARNSLGETLDLTFACKPKPDQG